ncbi:hypothetical protein FHS89_001236 [Rubricella aquisinus]|uniref:DUF1217 domain-containing protein n=1 Tax=Rubricella aquisinus TaxID=2028108 RepID=A0A840WZZ9_9RHOB|nr:DUF1217 domain-containing protein [Rubricella aquisinus]MBB5515226.1 hypothetical protein [Rubricella aquisinus]
MSFTPALPLSGLPGLRFLDRTYETQFAAFEATGVQARDAAYFRDQIGSIQSADELVADRRLLSVALGAFGLEDEINKTALLQKVLEEGTLSPESIANRLGDARFAQFSKAFGFGDILGPQNRNPGFAEDLANRYLERGFERAVGEVNNDLRLAMNFRREIAAIATSDTVDRTGWFSIMGTPPLRAVVEQAFGLPTSFGQLDIDQQREVLEDRSEQILGQRSPAALADGEAVEAIITRFMALSDTQGAGGIATSGAAMALQLLSQPNGLAGQSLGNILLSNARL